MAGSDRYNKQNRIMMVILKITEGSDAERFLDCEPGFEVFHPFVGVLELPLIGQIKAVGNSFEEVHDSLLRQQRETLKNLGIVKFWCFDE